MVAVPHSAQAASSEDRPENYARYLLFLAGLLATVGGIVTVIWFAAEPADFSAHADNLPGVKTLLGAQLVVTGLVLAVIGFVMSLRVKSEQPGFRSVTDFLNSIAMLLDKGGGIGIVVMAIGALLLGIDF